MLSSEAIFPAARGATMHHCVQSGLAWPCCVAGSCCVRVGPFRVRAGHFSSSQCAQNRKARPDGVQSGRAVQRTIV